MSLLVFFGETDCTLPAWETTISVVACETLLHHLAQSELSLSFAQAVQAEHFLHGTESLSKRYQMELASQDHASLSLLALQTEVKVMELLCLSIDVNSKWKEHHLDNM